MYFEYMINWLYRSMQLPVPIVVSSDVIGVVTVFDIFMFTVYIAVFVILIRYIITDSLSFKVGTPEDISYNSNMYISKHLRKSRKVKEVADNVDNN